MASTGRWRRASATRRTRFLLDSYFVWGAAAPPALRPALLKVTNGRWELSLWLINCTWAPDTNWGNVNCCGLLRSHFHVWKAGPFLRRGGAGGGVRVYPYFVTEKKRTLSKRFINPHESHFCSTLQRLEHVVLFQVSFIWFEASRPDCGWFVVLTHARGYWPLINIRSLLITLFTIMLGDSLRDIQRNTGNWNTSRVSDK